MENAHHNSTLKVRALCALLSTAIFALPLQAEQVEKREVPVGTTFKLVNGVRLKLIHVNVIADGEANGLDFTVELNRDDAGDVGAKEAMIEQAEFCLRYSKPLLAQSLSMSQFKQVKKLTVVYVGAITANAPFAFPIETGQCVLDAPVPAELIATAFEQANEELD